MTRKRRIAIVDDDAAQRHLLRNALERAGFHVLEACDGAGALDIAGDCALMLLDVRMPGMSGLEALEVLRKDLPQLPVILLTAYIDVRDAVAAIKQGAADYLEKPIDLDELVAAVEDAIGDAGPGVAPGALRLPKDVVAESPAMRRTFEDAQRVAETDATVLFLGESGTGKEVLARFVHAQSTRAGGPLIAVDCSSLPENLVESELFGHVKGAFTDAREARAGRFKEAAGGTIFLDEVGELPPTVQPKLLRVLESGVFRAVGASDESQTTVRVIAATNRDLEAEAREGRFRQDLFFRLNVFPILLPPLRDRGEDILPLADHFLKGHKKKLSGAAERLLMSYAWPGNVRELRNVLERAAILTSGGLILPSALPPQLHAAKEAPDANRYQKEQVENMGAVQKRAILDALEKTAGNKTHAAALLGISRRNLVYKLRSYGM